MSLLKLRGAMVLTLLLVFGTLFAVLVLATAVFQMNITFAVVLTALLVLLQWYAGPGIIKWSTKMEILEKGERPELERMVSELVKKAEIPMPQLAVVPNQSPNAFVFGRSRKTSILAVHEGLLKALKPEEVKAVLAHEVGHLKHNDCQLMTVVSAIPMLAYMMSRSVLFTRGRRSGSLILFALGGFFVYIFSQALVMNLSRTREYFADHFSGTITGKPIDLANALAKISLGLSTAPREKMGNARAFYIEDPVSARREIAAIGKNAEKYDLNKDGVLDEHEIHEALKQQQSSGAGRFLELFSTHPRTFKRLKALHELNSEIEKKAA